MVYGASDKENEYTLATPICVPLPAVALDPLLLSNNLTVLVFWFNANQGVPCTLLIFNFVPNSKGTSELSVLSVSLGFSTSTIVVDIVSISYPFTYAVPADTLTAIKSSDGVLPWSVCCPSKYTPSFDSRLLSDSFISTLKLSNE